MIIFQIGVRKFMDNNSFLDLKQCSQLLCNFKNKDGKLDGVMCGISGTYCTNEDWCGGSSNEIQSRWSTGAYHGNTDCNSRGESDLYVI